MSFIDETRKGVVYAPGYFLGHEECTRETREMPTTLAVTAGDGSKYVPMGTIYPANDATAEGIVYEDVDVTTGDMPGSIVTSGFVFPARMRVVPTTVAINAMTGITFVDEPAVTRPDFD